MVRLRRRVRSFARGLVEKVRDQYLGGGLRLQVHKLKPPSDPEVRELMERAREAALCGDGAGAARLARKVWKQSRGDAFGGVWAGQMLAKHGKREEAAEVYCACEGLPVGSWEGYWALGRFLLVNGLVERAVLFLERALEVEPRALDAHLDMSRCLSVLGRPAEAQARLDEARRLDPKARL